MTVGRQSRHIPIDRKTSGNHLPLEPFQHQRTSRPRKDTNKGADGKQKQTGIVQADATCMVAGLPRFRFRSKKHLDLLFSILLAFPFQMDKVSARKTPLDWMLG
jgi:hypothetical protein